jgi:hypothetical protein
MEEIQNQIESRLRWFEYVKKINKHRIPERLSEVKKSRRRPRGRRCR